MRRLRHTLRRNDGFTMVEMLMAALVLIIGMGALVTTFTASRKLTLVAERQTSMAHRANLELERLKSLQYNQIALTGTSSSWSTNPSSYTYASVPTGSCPGTPSGAAPTYQPDHRSGGSSATEPLVINGCSYTLSGTSTQVSGGTVAPVTAWTDGRFSGFVYDFITWTSDPTCSQTSSPGSACPTTNDYKRITIVVTITGVARAEPSGDRHRVLAEPEPEQPAEPRQPGTTHCTNSCGQSVPCTGSRRARSSTSSATPPTRARRVAHRPAPATTCITRSQRARHRAVSGPARVHAADRVVHRLVRKSDATVLRAQCAAATVSGCRSRPVSPVAAPGRLRATPRHTRG